MSKPCPASNVVTLSIPTPFQVGPVNAYLIMGSPLILVDTGVKTDLAFKAMVDGLAEHGVALKDLEVILITHNHVDHIGLLARILEETNAECYAHPYAVKQAQRFEEADEEGREFILNIMREMGAPPGVIRAANEERDSYKVYGEQVVIGHSVEDGGTAAGLVGYHVPGHSVSDTLFVNAKERYAFTGDHLLKKINPNPLLRRPMPGQPRAKSLLEYRESLLRTRALDIQCFYPGHGPIFADHQEVIDGILRRQNGRANKILEMLGSGARTPHELCMQLFPDIKIDHLFLGLSSTVGHLELLEDQGKAVSEDRGGVLFYKKS